MGLLFKFKKTQQDKWGFFLQHAFKSFKSGEMIIFPKGSVYHLGGNPFDLVFLNEFAEIYSDPFQGGFPLIVDSLATAQKLAEFSPTAKKMAKTHWPGDLLLQLPAKKNVEISTKQDTFILNSIVYSKDGLISIEVNSNPVLDAFFNTMKEQGYPPIIVGVPVEIQPGLYFNNTESILDLLGVETEYLILDAGNLGKGNDPIPSTILRIKGDQVDLVHEGILAIDDLEEQMQEDTEITKSSDDDEDFSKFDDM